jgi:hypothetical protein
MSRIEVAGRLVVLEDLLISLDMSNPEKTMMILVVYRGLGV